MRKILRLAKFGYFSILSGSALLISLLSSINQAQAQEIARTRFVWDFTPASGTVYFNVCTEPEFNINERTGGCANINVLNSEETENRDRTRLVSDKLRSGLAYKACLVADNIGGRYQGRWIQCQNFIAKDGRTIRFGLNQFQYVGSP